MFCEDVIPHGGAYPPGFPRSWIAAGCANPSPGTLIARGDSGIGDGGSDSGIDAGRSDARNRCRVLPTTGHRQRRSVRLALSHRCRRLTGVHPGRCDSPDLATCGACGNTCGELQSCINSNCVCAGYRIIDCDGGCVNSLDAQNCGGCGIHTAIPAFARTSRSPGALCQGVGRPALGSKAATQCRVFAISVERSPMVAPCLRCAAEASSALRSTVELPRSAFNPATPSHRTARRCRRSQTAERPMPRWSKLATTNPR